MQKINITNSVIATHGRSAADSGHSTRGSESVSQDWGVKEFSSCIHPTTAVIVRRAWSDCEQNPDILFSGDGWHIRYSGDCSSGVQRSVAEVPESDKDSAAESPGECWMIPVNPPSYMLVSQCEVLLKHNSKLVRLLHCHGVDSDAASVRCTR